MPSRILVALTLICAGCLSVPTHRAQALGEAGPTNVPAIAGLADQGFTAVEGYATLREDWGTVALRLEVEGYEARPFQPLPPEGGCTPVVRAQSRCGPCELRTAVFRAPTYPQASDVIRATVVNRSQDAAEAVFVVDHTAAGPDFTLSPEALAAGNRQLIGLPGYAEPTLPMNEWGLASNAGPIPGWARPNEACDPAFKNISVGWRGDPITYRFKVEPNAGRTVILGVCESHWTEPGQRPLILQVEGAADMRVDPIGDWGQHVPKCLPFQAKDVNGDGWLTVTSITPTDAPDRNSILNVIWVFPAGAAEDTEAVKRGERSEAAGYYVDVGGERDQSLYTVGDIPYHLELQPGEEQTLTFVVASQGGSAPAGPETPIEADRLLAKAEGLWREWFDQGCRISVPEPGAMDVWNASLAAIMMVRGQASKYIIPRPSMGPASFSHEAARDIIRALDLSGHHRDAEACLLMLWDSPLPQPIAQYGQREDGSWKLSEDDWCSQGRVLAMLAEHYSLTGDRQWLAKVYPSVAKGTEWLGETLAAQEDGLLPGNDKPSPSNPNEWAMRGLRHAHGLAAALGRAEDEKRVSGIIRRLQAARAGLPPSLLKHLDWEASPTPSDPARTVPFSHWAYDALEKLVAGGVLFGYPERHEFRPERPMTRYELAMAVSGLPGRADLERTAEELPAGLSEAQIREMCVKPKLTTSDAAALALGLLVEFRDELDDLGDRTWDIVRPTHRRSDPAATLPTSHWVYDALQKLVDEGVILGFPEGHDFKSRRSLRRYELAMAASRLTGREDLEKAADRLLLAPSEAQVRQICAEPKLTTSDTAALALGLLTEFRGELEDVGDRMWNVARPAHRASDPAATVPTSHWAYDALQKLVDEGVIIGYPEGYRFKADRQLTRYEFAMAISRLMDWLQLAEAVRQPVESPSEAEVRAICAKAELTDSDRAQLCFALLDEFKLDLIHLMEQINDLAEDVGEPDDRAWRLEDAADPSPALQRLRRLVGEASSQGFLATRVKADTREAEGAFPDAARGAGYIQELRRMLIREAGQDLRLMPLAPAEWLMGEDGVMVEGAPTDHGSINFRARIVGNALKVAIMTAPRFSGRIWLSTFASEERKPVRLQVNGEGWRGDWMDQRRALWLSPSATKAVVTVEYE